MAGIETASAIIGIAHVGFALSKALIIYIDEVKDASRRLSLIGNEIRTTSERLEDIGKLVGKNLTTNFLSSEGIRSAIRASEECAQVIEELRGILGKSGCTHAPTVVEKEEIDISYFTEFKWPWVKFRLEAPRAELQRIKADLTLLFASVMAIGASNKTEKMYYYAEIVNTEKTRKWAAQKARNARLRAKNAGPKGGKYSVSHSGSLASFTNNGEDKNLRFKFVRFKEEQALALLKRRREEEAFLALAKEEAKREAEEEERKRIKMTGIMKYKEALKLRQAERESHIAATKEALRTELERLNFPSDKIQSILGNIHLTANDDNDSIIGFPGLESDSTTNVVLQTLSNLSGNSKSVSRKSKRNSIWKLFHRTKKSPTQTNPTLISDECENAVRLESWVWDSASNLWVEFKEGQLENGSKPKSQHFWVRYSQLPSKYRSSFQEFNYQKNECLTGDAKLRVLDMEPIKKVTKTGIFSRTEEDIGLRVLLARKNERVLTSRLTVQEGNGAVEGDVAPVPEVGKELESAEARIQEGDQVPRSVEKRAMNPKKTGIPTTRRTKFPHRPHQNVQVSKLMTRYNTLNDLCDTESDSSFSPMRYRPLEEEMRRSERVSGYAGLRRKSLESYTRTRQRQRYQEPLRLHKEYYSSPRERTPAQRPGRTFSRRDSDWLRDTSLSRASVNRDRYDRTLRNIDSDYFDTQRALVPIQRRSSEWSKELGELRRKKDQRIAILFKKRKQDVGNDSKGASHNALVLSTLKRLTNFDGDTLLPELKSTFPTNFMPATAPGPPPPLPLPSSLKPYMQLDSSSHFHPYGPHWMTNRIQHPDLNRPSQATEEKSGFPNFGGHHSHAVAPEDFERGPSLTKRLVPEPQITVSGPSAPRFWPSSRGIYDSPVSIRHTVSAEATATDTNSDEERDHSSRRARNHQVTVESVDDLEIESLSRPKEADEKHSAKRHHCFIYVAWARFLFLGARASAIPCGLDSQSFDTHPPFNFLWDSAPRTFCLLSLGVISTRSFLLTFKSLIRWLQRSSTAADGNSAGAFENV
ncbi:hypothetical protein PAAG_00577 [Paracoccidioides lutzii Pb01]|uniref:Fungal N-terminal domain-containing protein n=1 Tax=Paracoccidioides lutzii (strain ATCC MYA-826 / Pb01) TaxID=502779 RepID=C1GPY2_PARBA|nr:hypothetical protein PAAG_00577 [Paracoccidioides lutzii Pb01]EEH36254.2 hypothetical protein PAAG_00577 [Paracoccidioides lutzii Pb01]